MTAVDTKTEMTDGFVDLSKDRIHYVEIGEGQPIVCIHGGGPGASGYSNFKQNAPGLAAAGFRAILVDLPQFGQSSKPFIPGSRLSYFGDAMVEFADKLELGPTHWIGNSAGGGAALRIAIVRPDLVDRLVLLGSAGFGPSLLQPSPLEGVKIIGDYYKGSGPSVEKMRKIVETFMYNQDLVTDELIKERYEASIDPEVVELWKDGYVAVRHTSSGPEDFTSELAKVTAPTLLVWGRDDRMVAIDSALGFLYRLPDARLYVFPRCGHWAQGEYPEEFNKLCLEFFAGNLGGPLATA